jgi:hypothetical protein
MNTSQVVAFINGVSITKMLQEFKQPTFEIKPAAIQQYGITGSVIGGGSFTEGSFKVCPIDQYTGLEDPAMNTIKTLHKNALSSSTGTAGIGNPYCTISVTWTTPSGLAPMESEVYLGCIITSIVPPEPKMGSNAEARIYEIKFVCNRKS